MSGCRYALECGSGPREFAYHCGERGFFVEDERCENAFESCLGGDAQVRCMGGSWELLGGGGDGPLDCPVTPPVELSDCPYSLYSGPAVCGYPCPDSDRFTVATCVFPAGPRWLYDGACDGHCGGLDQALFGYLMMHDECTDDDDCTTVSSSCSSFAEHCSGAIAVNSSIDEATFADLDAALSSCASNVDTWDCARCDALPPSPRCVNGRCAL